MLRRLLALFSLALMMVAAHAAESGDAARASLARFLDGVQTFEAGFTQVQTDDRGHQDVSSVGQMALSRPGKFRWEYQQPNKQLIVTDGSTLWLYDEDIKQVTIRSAAEGLQGTPAALLSQKKTLTDAFSVSDDGKDGEITKLRLVPKGKDSDFRDISLWLNAAGAPVRMIFRDQLGGSTDISFSGIKTNGRLNGRQFSFSAPKGVEVITQ